MLEKNIRNKISIVSEEKYDMQQNFNMYFLTKINMDILKIYACMYMYSFLLQLFFQAL